MVWLKRTDSAAPAEAAARGSASEKPSGRSGGMGFDDQIRELARDLVTLEVNTIIKSNMTGERMPSVPNALLDIVRDYLKVFKELRIDVSDFFARDPGDPNGWKEVEVRHVPLNVRDFRFVELSDPIRFGRLFERLRWAAKNTRYEIKNGKLPASSEAEFLLDRVEHNSDTLRTVLDRYEQLRDTEVSSRDVRADHDVYFPPVELTARDILIVKKIWEIGVEKVVAQTSIQLDGDVVTRIAQHLTADRERTEQVLMIHQQGIQTGIGNWRAIIDAAVSVIGGMTGRVGR